jgi:dipeptidyl aminopeptidase/acylaminoacyl peptidase
MLPGDLAGVEIFEQLDVSGDGSSAVVTRRRTRRRRGRLVYESHLLLIDLAGATTPARPRALTEGVVADSSPRLCPDGTTVAFCRSDPLDPDASAQLCTIDVRSRRVRVLAPKGARPGFAAIREPAWSPDGRRLAFVADVDPPRWIVGERPPIGSAAWRSSKLPSPVARRITRTDWRWDGEGHLDHWSHLFVLDVAAGAGAHPRQVTRGDWSVGSITWHPDGRTVAFVADRGERPDLHPRPTIWSVDVDAGPRSSRSAPRCILDAAGGAGSPAFSPDGRWLAAVGLLTPQPLDDLSPGLLLARADGSGSPVELSPELDRPIGNWTDSDLTGWMVSGRYGPFWQDESSIVAVVTDRGRSLPECWTIDRRTGQPLTSPRPAERAAPGPWAESVTHAMAVTANGDVITLSTEHGRGLEVTAVDLVAPSRRLRANTSAGTAWQRRFDQPEMRRVEAPGEGGPIETWIASPPGSGDAALPTIVAVHGGPLGGWAPAPHIETIVLTGAGYRVVCPNIRGGAGYGRDWIRPQLGDWGGVDADDVHAALDHAIALGLADPDRLGVFGLSYGGFMVNWMVGTSDRFRAAVSENGVTNQVSAWANSDSGPDYCRTSLLGDTLSPDGVAKLWRQSPLRHVADVHTPLLMLQGEADVRCPPQDNEQFFIALQRLGRTVEYVLYPDSHHVYGYSGRPDRRIDRMQRVLDWFNHHLLDD